MKKQTVALSRLLLVGILALSCAKERPYEEVEGKPIEAFDRSTISIDSQQTKLDETGKSTNQLVVGKTKYLYLKSTHGAPRKVIEADPYFQGQQKLVQAEWTKDGLLLSEIEPESKFQHVPENFNPVILIPGKYLSYRCTTDANGECQNKEEEDPSTDWTKKRFFVPEFASIKNIELNDLDLFGVEGIFNQGCVSPVHTVVSNYEVSNDGINIEIERFYKVSPSFECVIDELVEDKTGSLGFRMKYMYSIVRLDKLASPDYEAVQYPVPDHDLFGFFTTEQRTLKDDNNPNTKARNFFLQRFNPKKKVIPYYLSDSFNRPENASIKKASYEAVDSINDSLRRADAGIQIELKEPAGKMPGDLRNNMLVLIDQYLDNNLLGYGPSVPNPLTGELVQAHVNMYSGVLRSMTRRVWSEMVELSKAQALEAKKPAPVEPPVADTGVVTPDAGAKPEINLFTQSFMAAHAQKKNILSKDKVLKLKNLNISKAALAKEKKLFAERANKKIDLKTHLSKLGDDAATEEYRMALERMSERNMYHAEFFNVGGTAKTLFPGVVDLPGVLNADGTLKEYNELSQSQRKEAADLIIVHTYKTTLIHEFGHNLGLRHNFQGSYDKANFYTEDEAKALGMRAAPAYSSIMDYGASELNELGAFGKYDVAALKYGYARKVELTDGTEADIKSAGSITAFEKNNAASAAAGATDTVAPLKSYAFCTDGNAGLNSPCNRFDEGTSLVEITKSHISSYKSNYKLRNLRDERLDFIDMDVDIYAARTVRTFKEIRNVFEDVEFYADIMKFIFTQAPPDVIAEIKAYTLENGCHPALLQEASFKSFCDRVQDAVDATKIAATFFMEVIKSPDLTCYTAEKDEQGQTVVTSFKLGAEFEKSLRFEDAFETSAPYSCLDPRVVAHYAGEGKQIVAENGRILNDVKDPNPEFKYSNDIYVRGVWTDKLIASKYLAYRRSDRMTSEDNFGALIDLSYVKEEMVNVLAHMSGVDEELINPNPATAIDGSKIALPYKLGTDDTIPEVSYYLGRFKKVFQIPSSEVSLNSLVFANLYASNTWNIPKFNELKQLDNLLSTRTTGINTDVKAEFLPRVLPNGKQVFATAGNLLAKANLETLMLSDVKGDEVQTMLAKEALAIRTTVPTLPTDLTAEESAIIALELDLLDQALLVASGLAQLPPEEVILTFLGEEIGKLFIAASKLPVETLKKLISIKSPIIKVPAKAEVSEGIKEHYEEFKLYFDVSLVDLQASLSEQGIDPARVQRAEEALLNTFVEHKE